jgi:hypothetical protein
MKNMFICEFYLERIQENFGGIILKIHLQKSSSIIAGKKKFCRCGSKKFLFDEKM